MTSTNEDKGYLSEHFLIAMPNCHDAGFSKSVTYLCQHDKEGALGIVVNKPHVMLMGDIFQQLGVSPEDKTLADRMIYSGGPVQPDRGFILHPTNPDNPDEWEAMLCVNEQVSLTSSQDIIKAIGRGEGPQKWMMALGYAGWGSGQLEQEMSQNAWLHNKAELALIFDVPQAERWKLAAEKIGVDLALLTSQAGHS